MNNDNKKIDRITEVYLKPCHTSMTELFCKNS